MVARPSAAAFSVLFKEYSWQQGLVLTGLSYTTSQPNLLFEEHTVCTKR